MMHHERQHLDSWLIRGKDITLIITTIGALCACFAVAVKYYNLPIEVQAQGAQIQTIETKITELHETDMHLSEQVALVSQSISNEEKEHKNLEDWMKSISARIK